LRFTARILSPIINWTQPKSSHSWGISGGSLCSVQGDAPNEAKCATGRCS